MPLSVPKKPQNSSQTLLDETLEFMKEHSLSSKDVAFVGDLTKNATCTWDEFAIMAQKITNKDLFNNTKIINKNIQIHFNNGTLLFRHEETHDVRGLIEYLGTCLKPIYMQYWRISTPELPRENKKLTTLL